MKDQQIITVHKNGETLEMHRCLRCWKNKCKFIKNGNWIAIDNGFIDLHPDEFYLHAEWCENSGKF